MERAAKRERNAVSLSEGPEGSRREAPTPSRQNWRRRPDLNRGWRFCRPLPYHLATAPIGRRCCGTTNTASYQTPSGQSRIRRAALPVASWTPPDRGMIEVPPSGNNSVVECDLAQVEVAGSNPVSRSIFLYARGRRSLRSVAWADGGSLRLLRSLALRQPASPKQRSCSGCEGGLAPLRRLST